MDGQKVLQLQLSIRWVNFFAAQDRYEVEYIHFESHLNPIYSNLFNLKNSIASTEM